MAVQTGARDSVAVRQGELSGQAWQRRLRWWHSTPLHRCNIKVNTNVSFRPRSNSYAFILRARSSPRPRPFAKIPMNLLRDQPSHAYRRGHASPRRAGSARRRLLPSTEMTLLDTGYQRALPETKINACAYHLSRRDADLPHTFPPNRSTVSSRQGFRQLFRPMSSDENDFSLLSRETSRTVVRFASPGLPKAESVARSKNLYEFTLTERYTKRTYIYRYTEWRAPGRAANRQILCKGKR